MTRGPYGVYEVIGRRAYRGHQPGTTFEAQLDQAVEQRAINRRDIRLLRRVIPSIRPGSFTLPDPWPPDRAASATTRGAERAPLSLRRR